MQEKPAELNGYRAYINENDVVLFGQTDLWYLIEKDYISSYFNGNGGLLYSTAYPNSDPLEEQNYNWDVGPAGINGPCPTFSKGPAGSNDSGTWNGYLANTDEEGNWTYSSDLTTNLIYSTIIPEVGKIYNEDATIVINPEGSSTDLSFVTATASEIVSGYTGADANGNPVEGNVPINNQDNIEINVQGIMTVNAGIYPAFTKELNKAQLAIRNIGIVADGAGWVDSSFYLPLDVGSTSVNNNVVTITRGWHEDESVEVGAAYPGTTITPNTETQTIAAQSYLLGDVVISGSDTFIEENIKDGVTIWGKTGTYKGEQTTDEELVGMLVDGPNGELMFQKLRFEGTESFADGDPIAIEGTYIYNTASLEEDNTNETVTTGNIPDDYTGELYVWQ